MSAITPDALASSRNKRNIREIIALPSIEEFYDELMDRLYMVLEQFFLKEKFTLFINVLPRDHKPVGSRALIDRFGFSELVYGGIERQREFLEGGEYAKDIDEYWNDLKWLKIDVSKSKISIRLVTEFQEGKYELEDIEEKCVGDLSDYFKPKTNPELNLPALNYNQECEYYVLKRHFTLQSTKYISLPLIQFAEFDGIVHVILSEADYEDNFLDRNKRLNTRKIGNVIKAFSREYEGLILDWDIVGGAKIKESSLDLAVRDEIFYRSEDNRILKQLEYQKYYRRHYKYFKERIDYNKRIPVSFREVYRQIAIIHILIDSYAHNISAHSLTALEWWFRQRAEMVSSKARGEQVVLPTNGQGKNLVALLRHYEMQLDKEIHPLLRFLLDKGAFWTGLTRDNSFGGRIMDMHTVLWRDFINNPLYLGTIAFTEGIIRLHINITFLEYVEHEAHMKVKKKVIFDGRYASIDLQKRHPQNKDPHDHISDFVVKGNEFEAIKERLLKYEGFFPGGIVGEHAFFTILETELRNVKHYTIEELEKIKQTGLILNISIEEDSYRYETENRNPDEKHYYKIGVWLKHPLYIDKNLMKLRPKRLYADIIDVGTDKNEDTEEDREATFLPKLGGTYQDKVCAAMLFNNTFASVENQETERDKRFYPWLKGGSSADLTHKVGKKIEDIEISARRLFNKEFTDSRLYFEEKIQPHYGYFKKFFFIWKGENIYEIEEDKGKQLDTTRENISRFRFIYAPQGNHDLIRQVHEAGIIRIIHEKTTKSTEAYHQWLRKWLKFDNELAEYGLRFRVGNNVAAEIDIKKEGVAFRNKKEVTLTDLSNMQKINLIHNPKQEDSKGNSAIRYRNHGILKEYFCKGRELSEVEMSEEKAAELLEVLGTRVCIFDNRIAARFKEINTDILKDQLNCTVYEERQDHWIAEKEKRFFKHNFLVVHLSFIETLKNKKGEKYNENDIRDFIDEQILDGGTIPENFILVITTGRGRTHWWEKLKNVYVNKKPHENIPPYTTFVTFRPVESLMASIENAITMKDDMELKYRLVKVLFGS